MNMIPPFLYLTFVSIVVAVRPVRMNEASEIAIT